MGKNDWLKWLGIIVAISPAIGYGLAYCYEKGYCDFFQIPQELIKIDWPTILLSILASLGGLIIALWLILMLVAPNFQRMSINRFKFYLAFTYGLVFLVVAISFLTVSEAKTAGIMYLFLLAFIFIAPSIIRRYRKVKKATTLIEKKLIEQKEPISLVINNKIINIDPNELVKKDFFTNLFSNTIVKYTLIFIAIIIIGFTSAYYQNRSQAMKQQIFNIPSSHPELVIIKIYGDNLICAPIDHQEKDKYGDNYNFINKKFIILKTDEPNLYIVPTKIGFVRVINEQ